jgi:CMP/dCMP kinase
MEQTLPFLITISRQLGSGGAYVGRELSKKFKIFYADREIISRVAEQFSVLEDDLESRDEKVSSFWQSYLDSSAFCSTDAYIPPPISIMPTDTELFKAEVEIIEHIAKERSAVIIGRCGSHILRDFPNHISVFLYGDISFRKKRIEKLYNLTEEKAGKMLDQSDKERTRYYHVHTGKELADTRQYDLSIDTSKLGVDKSIELILKYLELRKDTAAG